MSVRNLSSYRAMRDAADMFVKCGCSYRLTKRAGRTRILAMIYRDGNCCGEKDVLNGHGLEFSDYKAAREWLQELENRFSLRLIDHDAFIKMERQRGK